MKPKRPILRYHGGKWKLAPWIIENLPVHRCYVEPFGGAASVLLRKQRSYAEVYNDLDDDVVNLFKVARERGSELVERLRLTPFSRVDFKSAYEPSADSLERAAKMVIRSFMGFGSNGHNRITGFRANSNRSGTTPAHDWVNYPKSLETIIERLQGVVIENRDACDVMKAHDSNVTLHYVDPPYVSSTRDRGKDYSHELDDNQHRALSECLHSLKGKVVLSGYACDLYEELYGHWHRIDRDAFADGARKRTESLWFNPMAELKELSLFTPKKKKRSFGVD
jgi:DNA adenine methylase